MANNRIIELIFYLSIISVETENKISVKLFQNILVTVRN